MGYKFDGKKWGCTIRRIQIFLMIILIQFQLIVPVKNGSEHPTKALLRLMILHGHDSLRLPYNCTQAPSFDKFGAMWVPTCGGGLAKMTKNGQWTVYNVLNSRLADDVVSSIAFDNDSGVWIATGQCLAFLN